MAYNPRKQTQDDLKAIYEVLGSNYAKTARYLNKNSRSRKVSANQVKRVIEGKGTRLTTAQVRRINRNTSTTAASGTKRTFVIKLATKKKLIEQRIAVKRARYQRLYDIAESVGDVVGMDDALNELSRLDDLNDEVQLAVRNARTADDYRGISDITTP